MKKHRAEEVLDELESYLNSAQYALFSNSQILVDRVKLEEYVQQLRQYLKEDQDSGAHVQ